MYRQRKFSNASLCVHEKLVPQIWPGITKLFRARESLFNDIPAGDRKIANLFLQCMIVPRFCKLFISF
jgi:hypothetical protein